MESTISFIPFSLVVSGNYTKWSEWSACNTTCDGGQQKRERNCTNPSPAHGGLNCTEQGLGAAEETLPCNEHLCPGKKVMNMRFCIEKWSSNPQRI